MVRTTSARCTLECEAARPIIPPRKNAKVWQHAKSSDYRLPRDEALREIRRTGRKAWKINVGYHSRSLVETSMHRLKPTFGDKLRSRKPPNQEAECRLRFALLNRFTQLGTPQFAWSSSTRPRRSQILKLAFTLYRVW